MEKSQLSPTMLKTARMLYAALILIPALVVIYLSAMGIEQMFVILTAFGAFVTTFFLWIIAGAKARKLSRSLILINGAFVMGCFAIITVPFENWPLKLMFSLYQTEFNRLADQLEQGQSVPPQKVGPYRILKAELNYHRMPCLWINPDPSGHGGFARPSDGIAEGKFNQWSDIRINEKWHLIKED